MVSLLITGCTPILALQQSDESEVASLIDQNGQMMLIHSNQNYDHVLNKHYSLCDYFT